MIIYCKRRCGRTQARNHLRLAILFINPSRDLRNRSNVISLPHTSEVPSLKLERPIAFCQCRYRLRRTGALKRVFGEYLGIGSATS